MSTKHTRVAEVHLDAMRGLAALIVALGHARGLFFTSLTGGPAGQTGAAGAIAEAGVRQITIGHQAVMVFFVLSGYLVGGSVIKSIANNTWSWQPYLIKRLVRLWLVLIPAIFIGLLLDNAGFTFLAHDGSIYTAPKGQDYVVTEMSAQARSISVIAGNILFLQTIFVPTLGTNIALWSLANEFWYYVAFPVLLLALLPGTGLVARLVYLGVTAGIAVLIGPHASYLFLTWLLGAAVSILPNRIPSAYRSTMLVAATIAFVLLFAFLKKLGFNPYVSEMLIAVATSMLLYTITCQDGLANASIYSNLAGFFSRISYTLYLSHLPFVIFICAFLNSPWTISGLSLARFASFLLAAGGAVAWAYLLYTLFEAKTDAVRAAVFALVAKVGARQEKA